MSSAWRRDYSGQPTEYNKEEVDEVMEAVRSCGFDPATYSWPTMLAPGDACAVHVGSQPTLKVCCLDKKGVAGLLGTAGTKLHQQTIGWLWSCPADVGRGMQQQLVNGITAYCLLLKSNRNGQGTTS